MGKKESEESEENGCVGCGAEVAVLLGLSWLSANPGALRDLVVSLAILIVFGFAAFVVWKVFKHLQREPLDQDDEQQALLDTSERLGVGSPTTEGQETPALGSTSADSPKLGRDEHDDPGRLGELPVPRAGP